jgi:hypothetical protein
MDLNIEISKINDNVVRRWLEYVWESEKEHPEKTYAYVKDFISNLRKFLESEKNVS